MTEPKDILAKLNLKPKLIKQILKTSKITERLVQTIQNSKIENLEEKKGKLLHELISKTSNEKLFPQKIVDQLTNYIIDGRAYSKIQIVEMINFFEQNDTFNFQNEKLKDFDTAIGVGLTYTDDEINTYIDNFITENIEEIKKKPNHPLLQDALKSGLKFVNPGILIKSYFSKTKEYISKPKKSMKIPKGKPKEEKKDEFNEQEADDAVKKFNLDKLMARDLFESVNTPELIKAHKERTGGVVITRFPPEPNGYLHIGHCKAMRFNFKVASDHGGYTNLRYDDTNPEKESQEFIDKILEGVNWMGYTPKNIYFASDYFPILYKRALELINLGHAYVCFLSKAEGKVLRESKKPSPYRETPIAENLRLFKLMKAGYYSEGECCLRAKVDYKHPNPVMRDPPMYRIKYIPHPHAGDKWCIYPLYDYAHSISDSTEDITHSLCTLEFENRRDLYYWSLNKLNIYRPYVWEFSRLNISNTVLSKRKVLQLVSEGYIDGWDDPRILTLDGMKRRGYPAEAINYFCDLISVTRSGNNNVLSFGFFEHCIRSFLRKECDHAFAVVEPVELEIVNFEEETVYTPEKFKYSFKLGKKVWVDKNDVREEDQKKFFGIAPGKKVRLRHGPFLRILEVKDNKVKAEIIKGEEIGNYKKIKGILHWVADNDSVNCEIRDYSLLFTTNMPGKKTGNILDDLSKDSKTIYSNSKISKGLAKILKIGSRMQFERKGYYAVDIDSDCENQKFVFNLVVGMKASKFKKELMKN